MCGERIPRSDVGPPSLPIRRRRLGARVGRARRSVGLADRWGWLVLPFVVLAVGAYLVGRRPVRPGAIGMIELGGFTLIAVGGVLASL